MTACHHEVADRQRRQHQATGDQEVGYLNTNGGDEQRQRPHRVRRHE
jgi:hypothetical protein